MDLQAMARAHRIGQKQKVTIFRLVTRNTYESEMFMRSSKKLGLDHALLTNLEKGKGELEASDAHDINKLLRLGAYGVFDEDDTAAKVFVEENIEEILKKRTKVITVQKESKEDEDGDDPDGSPAPRGSSSSAAAGGSASGLTNKMNANRMKFAAEGSTSTSLSIDDVHFWQKLLPLDDSERFTPDQLLSQLTDNSAIESEKSKEDFFRYLSATTEKLLRLKREGEESAAIDDLQLLLIQFAATAAFTEPQRGRARVWLEEAEKRVERKARNKTVPVRPARATKQRGTIGDDDVAGRGRKGGPKFGRINADDDSELSGASDDSGSDFGDAERRGGGGRRAARDRDDSDSDEVDPDEHGGRRHNKQRVARGLKRGRGLLNLDICEICHQSGKMIAWSVQQRGGSACAVNAVEICMRLIFFGRSLMQFVSARVVLMCLFVQ